MKRMKRIFLFMVIVSAISGVGAAPPEDAVGRLVYRADMKRRGTSSEGSMTMTVVRPDWKRTVSMKAWSLGLEYSLIVITAPAKEKGQAFLKRKNEMWSFVPSIDRIVKLPPSMMGQSWMGSDFTNDDLLKESSLSSDYTHKLLGEEKTGGHLCSKIEAVPKEDAAVVWGKILLWITKDDENIIRSERYDEDGDLMSVETADNIKKVDDRVIPTHMEMVPSDKPGNRTILETGDTKFNIPLKETFFSQQNLRKVR
jgi:outer membrane lipoprotein-sorting protein